MAYYRPTISVGDRVRLNKNYRHFKRGEEGVVKSVEFSNTDLTEYASVMFSDRVRNISLKFLDKIPAVTPYIPYDDLFE